MRANKRKKRLRIIIAIMLLAAAGLSYGIFRISSQNSIEEAIAEEEEETTEAAPEEPEQSPKEVLFFASDYQQMSGWDTPADTLSGILQKAKEDGKDPTNVIYCGDYTNDSRLHDYQLSPDASIEEIRSIVARECSNVKSEDMIFEQGNHDSLTDEISVTGLHEFDNYLVYVLNTQYDFPWKQGRDVAFKDRVINASEEMKSCFDGLIAKGENRPVFIAGHVPLHFTARTSSRHDTGDNMYASYIFDVLNEAGKSLDIVFMYGHNHSKGWDCYMGGSSVFKEAGETILIPELGDSSSYTDEFSTETLNFTYMNAGYTGYYINCGPSEDASEYAAADSTLSGTVCEIMQDEIIITRYSSAGVHNVGSEGAGDPYKGGIDSGLIGSEYYSKQKDGPVHIKRKIAIPKEAEEAVEEESEEKTAA